MSPLAEVEQRLSVPSPSAAQTESINPRHSMLWLHDDDNDNQDNDDDDNYDKDDNNDDGVDEKWQLLSELCRITH